MVLEGIWDSESSDVTSSLIVVVWNMWWIYWEGVDDIGVAAKISHNRFACGDLTEVLYHNLATATSQVHLYLPIS